MIILEKEYCYSPFACLFVLFVGRHDPSSLLATRYGSGVVDMYVSIIIIINCTKYRWYSKHPHIRTLILEVRLIRFLYIGCLVKNQPEGVLKLFLKIGGGNQNCNKYTKKSLRLN